MWEPFIDIAMEYLKRQQDRMKVEFQLGSWPRYDFDQEAGTLTFSSNGLIGVVADIHIVGSTSKSGGTWLWAWNNPSILDSVKHCMTDVREYGEVHGLEKLTTAKWPGDEHDGWRPGPIRRPLARRGRIARQATTARPSWSSEECEGRQTAHRLTSRSSRPASPAAEAPVASFPQGMA